MQNQQLRGVLTEFGLSAHEADIYLASLALGPTTIQKIAEAAEIKRTTTYSVVDSLQRQGLMTVHIKGFKKVFAAETPEKLEAVLESRKELLKKALPEFLALYSLQGGESSIKLYQGLAGIKSVYEGLIRDIRPKEDYLIISQQEQWVNLDPKFFLDFTKRRAKLPIKIRLLVQDSPTAREHKRLEKTFNEHIKFLPPGTSLNTNLVITPQRVVIHQLVPPVSAIVIENPSVIRMHKELFEIMWRSIAG